MKSKAEHRNFRLELTMVITISEHEGVKTMTHDTEFSLDQIDKMMI